MVAVAALRTWLGAGQAAVSVWCSLRGVLELARVLTEDINQVKIGHEAMFFPLSLSYVAHWV